MARVAVGVLALALATGTAAAAEPVNWSGWYIGAHGGYGWGQLHPPAVTGVLSQNGGFGGLQLGFNYRLAGPWVWGVETDISFGSLKGEVTLPPPVRT